jgi:hypothetical protein
MRGPASSRSGTPRTSPIWPRALLWSLITVAAGAALVGLGWLLGTTEPKFRGSFIRPLEHTLRSPIVSAVAAAALTVLLLWAVRRIYLCALTYGPGPISVSDFSAGEQELEPLIAPLTLRFRQALTGLYLDAQATSQPAAADATEFAGLVGQLSIDPKQAFASLVTLIRAAAPTHAYEVQGVLRKRKEEPSYGVALQVLIRPKDASALELCWEPTWERAVERAANTAAAFILPQTRRCRLSPWRAWRRYMMPGRLLDAYERASARVEARRYEEALGLFREALEEDPMNLDIRLRMGMVQEQLGLSMDALDTYVAMDTIQKPPDHPPLRQRLPSRVKRARRRTANVARYRRSVLLGGGEVALQWMRWQEGERETARDLQRRMLRRRLRPWLDEKWPTGTVQRNLDIDRQLADDDFKTRTAEMQFDLAGIALADLERLRWRAWYWRRKPLSAAAISTSHECVRLRRELVKALHPDCATTVLGPPPSVKDLEKRLRGALRRRGQRSWEARYNGACLYAIALSGADCISGDAAAVRRQLVENAMAELHKAIRCTDSGYVANRAPWLLVEDPDLNALRPEDAFRRLESHYFLRDHKEGETQIEDRHKAALREHTKKLCAGYAGRLEELWHYRADEASTVDIHVAGRWWGREREAWQLIAALAVEYMDWQTRLQAIDKLRSWAQEAGIEPLEIPYPPPRDWSPDPDESVRQIGLPAGVIEQGVLIDHLRNVDNRLRDVDRCGERLPPEQFAHVARCQAALWQTVREDVDPPRFKGDPEQLRNLVEDLEEVIKRFGEAESGLAALMNGRDSGPPALVDAQASHWWLPWQWRKNGTRSVGTADPATSRAAVAGRRRSSD